MTDNPIDHAYLAGLLDGEGSICCSDSQQGTYLVIAIGMRERAPLDWAAEKYGGKVYSLKEGYTFQWIAPADSREVILDAILPYLKVKGEQAALGIAFCKTVRPRSNRKALTDRERLVKRILVNRLQSLNRTNEGGSQESRRHTKEVR